MSFAHFTVLDREQMGFIYLFAGGPEGRSFDFSASSVGINGRVE